MKRWLTVLFLLLLSLGASASWADGYRYAYYGAAEGLCDEYVLSTYKDRAGYLWICTSNGLDRFDGNRFIHFSSHSDDPGTRINNDFVYGVAEDGRGDIWAVTNSGLLCIHVKDGTVSFPDSFGDHRGTLSRPMISILSDREDHLWLLERNGLIGVSLDRSGNVAEVNSIPSVSTSLRYFAVQGDLIWTGGFSGIECFRKSSATQAVPLDLSLWPGLEDIQNVSTILADGRYLWVGTENGLFCYNTQGKTLESFRHDEKNPLSLSDNHVTCLAADRAGEVLVGTSRGIDHYSRSGHFDHITQGRLNRSLNTNYVNHILLGEDGTLWVSTLVGGINQITPRAVAFEDLLSVTEGTSNIISCCFEDRDGNLFLGVLGKGLGILRKGEKEVRIWSLKENGGISQEDIFVVRQDHNGDYWLASRNDGLVFLSRKDLDRPRFQAYSQTTSNIGSNVVVDIEFDPLRRGIWLCTNEALEFLDINSRTFKRISLPMEDIEPVRIHSLYLDSRDRLWAGGYGMFVLDLSVSSEVMDRYDAVFYPSLEDPSGPVYERITSIVETSDGNLYFGSHNNGVYHAEKDGTFQPIRVHSGPFQGRVATLVADTSGDLWIGTTEGVYHYAPGDELLTRFDRTEGLPSGHCYIDSGYRFSDGRVALGTANGLIIFDTPFKPAHGSSRKVMLTGIQHQNHLDLKQGITSLDVYPSNPSFELQFSSMDLPNAQGVLYSYRLDGEDEDWNVTSTGSVRYNNLKPGQYTFRVRCTDPDGAWSPDDTEFSIRVHPRFVQTVWFWLPLALLLMSLIAYIVVQNFRNQRIKQRELSAQVAEKTADLRTAMQDIIESKESIEKQNLLLEEQKVKLEEYSRRMDRANREKLMLYTNLTHEFKTPLSLILGPVSELMSSNKDKEIAPALQIVERNSKYLLSLVNQILDLRRVDAGQIRLKKEPFNLERLVDIYALDYKAIFAERNIAFEPRFHWIHKHILSDRDAIHKILSNLVSNAVKHTPDGGRISLGMAQFPRRSDGVMMQYLSVSNTGSCIPESEFENIFGLFYKIDGQASRPVAGQGNSGIGLYLVKQLVSALGGEIRVKSTPRTGTSFRVLFPVDLVNGQTIQNDDLPYTPPEDPDTPVLLLVEDNADMRSYIRSQLSDRFHIAEAVNGERGYDMAKKVNPDFIISDLMMPVCDGLEFCRRVRADNTLSHIPFLMLTALSDDDARLSSYKEGVDAFLVKPFEKEMLLARIESILTNRRQQQSELSFDLKNAYANVNIERSDKVFMENLLSILRDNYMNPDFSVPQLQSLMCMSMTPFYKKISALTGLTPALFIRLYRLQTARKLLEAHTGDSGISVSEIAYQVGFNDPKYFSKCFQNQYHVLPSSILQGGGVVEAPEIES